MLEAYFEFPYHLKLYRTTRVGPFMDGFASWLQGQGYGRWSAPGFVRGVHHLGLWMERRRYGLSDLNAMRIAAFRRHFRTCKCIKHKKGIDRRAHESGVGHFLRYLHQFGYCSPEAEPTKPELPPILKEFLEWLEVQCGLAASTRKFYTLVIGRFIEFAGTDGDNYSAGVLRKFVATQTPLGGIEWVKSVVSNLRKFISYLATRGMVSVALIDAVPSQVHWKRSSCPDFYTDDEMARIIASCDDKTPVGLRDRAVLLLLSRLGLRVSDVLNLDMADIDWEMGTLDVMGKTRRGDKLPLPQEVGDALLKYFEYGRPKCSHPRAFIRAVAPHVPFSGPKAVCSLVDRAVRRAGITAPRGGGHILRHSAATSLLNQGASLEAIGTVLRHQTIATTTLYTKVDHTLLAQIAQVWPEEVI